MGRLVFLLLFLIFGATTFATEQASVEYSAYTIDYAKLDEITLKTEAEHLFELANLGENQEKYIAQALGVYQLLLKKCPDKVEYCVRLGQLYSMLKKDRYAKEYYYRAITLNPTSHLPYESFGDFYYERSDFRNALKQYKRAYNSDNKVYNVNFKMGTIYHKLGDTHSALKYLKEAETLASNEELTNKIRILEELNSLNAVYYQNTRLHFVED